MSSITHIPTIGRVVLYRTDGRNGLVYDLPAIVTCTQDSHPGDYPDGRSNPLPVPETSEHLHLTVLTPGGFGSKVVNQTGETTDADYVGADAFLPGSGTYTEWNVPPHYDGPAEPKPRTWRWPERS